MIEQEEFNEVTNLANELIDFADGSTDAVIGMALLMAAVPYLIDAEITVGHAARVLRILMKTKIEETQDGTTH